MPFFNDEPWYDGVYLQPDKAREFVAQLNLRTQAILGSDDSIPNKHNAYTLYVVSLLMWATAHRPVRDPFADARMLSKQLGLAIICDKVVDEDRAFRLAPLCLVAQEQIAHYRSHLQSIFNKWHNGKPQEQRIAKTCQQLLNDDAGNSPLFFLINSRLKTESIRESDIEHYWRELLPLPPNFGRPFLTSNLPAQDVKQEDILVLLGHSVTPYHWAGANSEAIPIDVMTRLRNAIQRLLTATGWRAIQGLKFYEKSSPTGRFKSVEPALHTSAQIGHHARALDRAAREKKATTLIQETVEQLALGDADQPLSNEDFDKLLDYLKNLENNEGRNLPLKRALANWLATQNKAGRKLPHRPLSIALKSEPSPFNQFSVQNYENVVQARLRFISWLKACRRNDSLKSIEMRIGALICSAALFGNCSQEKHLRAIARSLPTDTFRTGGVLHIELYSELEKKNNTTTQPGAEDTPKRKWVGRWLPDTLSALLLAGIQRGSPPALNGADVNRGLTAILKEICVKPSLANPIKSLSEMSKIAAIFELPGYIAHQRNPSTLRPSAWVRLLTDKIPEQSLESVGHSLDGTSEDPSGPQWLPSLIVGTNSKSLYTFKRGLRSLINEVLSAKEAGQFIGRKAANKALAKGIQQLVENIADLPTISRLVASWAYHLCLHGTPEEKLPAISTLDKYIFLVYNSLYKEVDTADFTEYTDEEFEETYLRALDNGKQEDQGPMVAQLYHFHSYLVDQLAIEDCHWGQLWSAANRKGSTVESDLVTQQEYHRALQLIAIDDALTERERLQYSGMMIFGFHFGLRFGEAFRLRSQDIQYTPEWDQIYIIVRKTVFGETKTEAGIRQVPNLTRLNSQEVGILRKLVLISETAAEDDAQVGLMADQAQRKLIDRSRLSLYLNALLKVVSGSAHARYHHLRHSFASHIHAAIATKHQQVRNDLVSPYHAITTCLDPLDLGACFSQPTRSLSVCIGHASLSTTARYYIQSNYLIKSAGHEATEGLTDQDLAYLLNEPSNTFKKRKNRLGDRSESIEAAIVRSRIKSLEDEGYCNYVPPLPDETRRFAAPRKPDPATIEHALHRLAKRHGTKRGLAEGLLLTDERLNEIIHAAEWIERRSGFDEYLVFRAVHDPHYRLLRETGLNSKQKQKEHLRLQKFLQSLQSTMAEATTDQLHQLRTDIDHCLHCLNSSRKRLVVINQKDVKAVIDTLDQLGLQADIRLESPPSQLASAIAELHKKHTGISVTVREKAPRSAERSQYHRSLATGMSIENLPKAIGNQRTFIRLLFILRVWLEVIGFPHTQPAENHQPLSQPPYP